MRDQLNRTFDFPETGWTDLLEWNPPVDILEDNDKLAVKAELPGFRKQDIDVSLHENSLLLSGERKHEEERKEGDVYREERYYGKFHRSIMLPTTVDAAKIQTRYRDGILTVTLPKAEQARAKHIEATVD